MSGPIPGLRIGVPDDLAHDILALLDELDGRQRLDGEHRDGHHCDTCTAHYQLGKLIHTAHAAAPATDRESDRK